MLEKIGPQFLCTSARLHTIHRNSSGHSSCNQANAPKIALRERRVFSTNWIESLVASWKSVRVSKNFAQKKIREAEAGKSRKNWVQMRESQDFGVNGWQLSVYQKVALFSAFRMFCLQKPSNRMHSEYPTISIFRSLSCWGWSNHNLFSYILVISSSISTMCKQPPCLDPVFATYPIFAQSRCFVARDDKGPRHQKVLRSTE